MTRGDLLDSIAAGIGEVSPLWHALLSRAAGAAPATAGSVPARLGVESIYEGYLLHYGAARLVDHDAPGAARMLIGDYCYAAGLCAVAHAGTLDQVATLADLIADVAAMARDASEPTPSPDPREVRWAEALSQLKEH